VSAQVLHLSGELAAAILLAASRAYPHECCGLVEGLDLEEGWQALAVHETANLAENPTRKFLVDPQAQFDLMRKLRGGERRILGCFHSHPDGSAEPSATDRADAYESNFLYLIAAGAPEIGFELKAYVFDADSPAFRKIPLVD
jgi:proteasome lid subunit RPN8/RPN11